MYRPGLRLSGGPQSVTICSLDFLSLTGLMRSPPSVATGLFAGRYAIEREIGQGASAIVYLARDTQAGTAVALKILRPELAESRASDRFLREIKRTSTLQHPNILPVLEAGEHEGQLFFALPYMEGGTLRQLLKREKHLELSRVLEISRAVAEALDYACERGLIHRDVKPENILFTEGRACLGDFGIARAIDISGTGGTGTTSRSMVRGTPAYMSPEQASGSEDLDGRSDVFSLACVIYEMITGMQAYIGPTDEAVIAQRFIHPPRDVRVYRPTASPRLDAALQKAFAMMPVDRYRTASALVAAIAASDASILEPQHTPNGKRTQSRIRMAAVVLGAATLAGLAWYWMPTPGVATSRDAGDTTRVVLLPVERTGPQQAGWREEDLLYQGFARWKDVQVVDQFQVADIIERRGRIGSNRDAQRLASDLGAGRYVRTSITPLGSSWSAAASLYDAGRGRSLYQASVVIPADLEGAMQAFGRLVDSLLLRGARADSIAPLHRARSLPAVQAYGRAQAALAEWDLESAEAALSEAARFDPDYARANLWLAQVRAWRSPSRNTWGSFAERAARHQDQLDERERRLALALVRLSTGDYTGACDTYESLIRRNPADVVSWFGIGQCNTLNKTVVPAPASPSGWRFVGSAHRAMQAYARALELLPSMYRRYDRGAYEQLRTLLLASNRTPDGYGAADSAIFFARPSWSGDSLVLIPYPVALQTRGVPLPPGFEEAIRRRRGEFRRLALKWSAAFPGSSGAKHAVAMALAQLGDPLSIDTMRAARSMSQDPEYTAQLAAAEFLLLLRFGFPENTALLRSAVSLGDSLLRTGSSGNAEISRALLPVAVLLGRCGEADSLLRHSGMDPSSRRFSNLVYVESYSVMLRSTLECAANDSKMSLNDVVQAADREALERGHAGGLMDGFLLLRPAIQTARYDTVILRRLVESTNHRMARAALFAARRDFSSARAELALSEREWGRPAPTADFGYATARVWLTIGDSSAAARVAESVLVGVRDGEPNELNEPGRAAGFAAMAALRTELARMSGDSTAERKWAAAVRLLLSSATPALQRRVASR